jgi:integrase
MKQQRGCIYKTRDQWALRWRENVSNGQGGVERKMRFKILGPVTSEHKRTPKRIPQDIQALAAELVEPVNSGSVASVLLTIGQIVEEYFKNKQFKPSTETGYNKIWKRYLQAKMSCQIARDFKRADAFRLWKQIHTVHPTLSKRTMQHIRFFVSGVFEFAKNAGYYSGENPAKADLPEGLPSGKETEAYTVEEVARLLSLLPSPLVQAIVAVAFGSGLRKGEIEGLDWKDYERKESGAVIRVRRSVWNRKVTTPKTESSADVVHVDSEVVSYIEAYRKFAGDVNEGFMFGYSHDRPINLDSLAKWQLKPLMNRCATCKEQKSEHNGETDHAYQRDESITAYKGWHGFRRGNATYLARTMNINGAETAALVLRHSNVATTLGSYIKDTKQERRAAKARKVVQITEQREAAALVLGAGLRQAAVN